MGREKWFMMNFFSYTFLMRVKFCNEIFSEISYHLLKFQPQFIINTSSESKRLDRVDISDIYGIIVTKNIQIDHWNVLNIAKNVFERNKSRALCAQFHSRKLLCIDLYDDSIAHRFSMHPCLHASTIICTQYCVL